MLSASIALYSPFDSTEEKKEETVSLFTVVVFWVV
jgi:hypothetical protein